MTDTPYTPVALVTDFADDGARIVTVGGRSILIVRSEGAFFAVENRCSHADQPLECGRVKRGWISCPAHGARFDLETGEPLSPPATDPIATFALRIDGETIAIAA